MTADNPLGEYLRAKRQGVLPEQVGLRAGPRRRRVEGLRREEVATLAGISVEYYIRLEQGRERHPSAQVLSGIARALDLDRPSEDFLRALVGHPRIGSALGEPAAAGLTGFLDALTATPAIAHDRVLEVVAANPLARALSPVFTVGTSLVEAAFMDAALADLYVNHAEMSARLVSYLRAQAAVPPPDPRLPEVVARLSAGSPAFAALWARHEVVPAAMGVNHLEHARYGRLILRFERLTFAGSGDPVVVLYHADPGSETERVLERVAADVREMRHTVAAGA